jgi:hypothetical protein
MNYFYAYCYRAYCRNTYSFGKLIGLVFIILGIVLLRDMYQNVQSYIANWDEGEGIVSPTIVILNKRDRTFEMLNYTWGNDRFQYDMLSVTSYLG